MKLLQFSDLHLSSSNETDYGFTVLAEIIEKAIELKCEALLLCGDIFDTYADLIALRTKFIELFQPYSGIVYFLPGNHESLRRQGKEKGFQVFDWGQKIRLLDSGPYKLEKISEEVELLSIPHNESYGELLLHLPQAKSTPFRIGMAHATVVGMSFTGLRDEEEEEKSGYLDVTQMQALGCDYIAIGHIHSARSQKFGNMEICYAGSARVWRAGETGERKGILLKIEEGHLHKSEVIFNSAGRYEDVLIKLALNGEPEKSLEEYFAKLTKYDWVRVRFSGIVESMAGKREFQNRIELEWGAKLRRLEFDSDESQVIVVENLLENAFIQNFVQFMDRKKDSMEEGDWSQAKELGLKLLLEVGK